METDLSLSTKIKVGTLEVELCNREELLERIEKLEDKQEIFNLDTEAINKINDLKGLWEMTGIDNTLRICIKKWNIQDRTGKDVKIGDIQYPLRVVILGLNFDLEQINQFIVKIMMHLLANTKRK